MDDLARDGLRTLMFAKRILSEEEANKLESKELMLNNMKTICNFSELQV